MFVCVFWCALLEHVLNQRSLFHEIWKERHVKERRPTFALLFRNFLL